MGTILNTAIPQQSMKLVVTLILLVLSILLLLRRQPPRAIQKMKLNASEAIRLKNLVGGLVALAALLYPIESILSANITFSKDFERLFWPCGLLVIGMLLLLLLNYYQKK